MLKIIITFSIHDLLTAVAVVDSGGRIVVVVVIFENVRHEFISADVSI